MDNDTLLNMILRHGARLEKLETDQRYHDRELLKLQLSTQHVQKQDNYVYEKIGRCC